MIPVTTAVWNAPSGTSFLLVVHPAGLSLQGIYFLLGIVAVAIVIRWSIEAEDKKSGAEFRGLLAMKRLEPKKDPVSSRRPSRRFGPGRNG